MANADRLIEVFNEAKSRTAGAEGSGADPRPPDGLSGSSVGSATRDQASPQYDIGLRGR